MKRTSKKHALLLIAALPLAGLVALAIAPGRTHNIDPWAAVCFVPETPALSNQQLGALNIEESVRSSWDSVKETANIPNGCRIDGPEARAGHSISREVYRMADGPDTLVVVGVEGSESAPGGEYTGFFYSGPDGDYQGGSPTPGASIERMGDLRAKQDWDLQPGSEIAGLEVSGAFGDAKIEVGQVTFSYAGAIAPSNLYDGCAIFATPQAPGYVTRLCGVSLDKPANIWPEDTLPVDGMQLSIALMREQPSGSWATVEPSREWLSAFLQAEG